jgi:hypothetical protein
MTDQDPLHREPLRPIVDTSGQLTNPIGLPPFVQLRDDQPMPYADLQPSTTYLSPGFEYLTDSAGMPARVRGALRLVSRSNRIRHSTAQRRIGARGSGADDRYHGGHIVAVSLGGFASGPNLFPQAANFNLSSFAKLEHSWRQALSEGCAVEVDIALTEGDDPDTPSFLIVTHWEDGTDETLTFLNEGYAL